MKVNIEYFPLGLAKGEYFCNRVKERTYLARNLVNNQHTLIMSPRRYGKSSLVQYVLDEIEIIYEKVDLFVALNEKSLEIQLLRAVNKLLNKISNKPEQILHLIRSYFSKTNKQWMIGTKGIHFSLIPDKENDFITNIMESLQALNNVLAKKEKRAVIFIDEFQEIANLPSSKAIEGVLRHVAQETTHLTFVFSGSNRNLLSNMFEDRSRPLYLLCDRLTIDRIPKEEYVTFINKFAQETWHANLPSKSLARIFEYSELHPYYLNALCADLWKRYQDREDPPTPKEVTEAWRNYVYTEKTRAARELSTVSLSQRKLLLAIAFGHNTNLTSKTYLNQLNLSASTIVESLNVLVKKDVLGRAEDNSYYLIDPFIKSSLLTYYEDILV